MIPLTAAAAGVVLSEEGIRDSEKPLKLMEALAEKLPQPNEQQTAGDDPRTRLSGAEGAGLRALRALLLEQDRSRFFGGLRRFRNASADFLWICPEHSEAEYDQGLPAITGRHSGVPVELCGAVLGEARAGGSVG